MAHWADNHVGAEQGKIQYRDRAPDPKKGGGGVVLGLVVVLLLGGAGGAGYWAWTQGYFTPAEEPIAAPAEPDTLQPRPRAAPAPAAVVEPEPEPSAPAMPAAGLSPQELDRIQRGIAHLDRQRQEHQAEADRYTEMIEAAQTKRAYPANAPRYTYEQWLQSEIAKARAAMASTASLQRQLMEFRAKVTEYQTKRAHELDVIDSLTKRMQAEQAKLP